MFHRLLIRVDLIIMVFLFYYLTKFNKFIIIDVLYKVFDFTNGSTLFSNTKLNDLDISH